MNVTKHVVAPLLLLVLMSGCLPTGCHHSQPEALFPADSVSRRIAASAPVDTLRRLWTVGDTKAHPLKHPRTVRFGPEGRLYVSDLKRSSIFIFDTTGAFQREMKWDAFAYPFLAGWRGDTLIVYNPQAHRLDFATSTGVARSVPAPVDDLPDDALTYAVATDGAMYVKVVGKDVSSYIARFGAGGRVRQRWPLPKPYWRHAGLLRPWGDSLLSLSGYRPVIDVLPAGKKRAAPIDTMTLRGFDSPMLARSRAYVQGAVDQPPLLTASATPAGHRLFVLNMRPAHLQVDVYDRRGRIQQVLMKPIAQKKARSVFPIDLAVKRTPRGYMLAVVTARPKPQLALYRWSN